MLSKGRSSTLPLGGERRRHGQEGKRRIRREQGEPAQTGLPETSSFVWKEEVWELLGRKSNSTPCLRDNWSWKVGEQGLNAGVHRNAHEAYKNCGRYALLGGYTELMSPCMSQREGYCFYSATEEGVIGFNSRFGSGPKAGTIIIFISACAFGIQGTEDLMLP